jgi:hypothetical protein
MHSLVCRQEIAELGEQVSTKVAGGVKTVSENVIGCTSEILAEKESNAVKFQKISQEIKILKARLATKQASEINSVTEGNTEHNNVTKVNGASQNASSPSGSVSEVNVSQHVSSCIDITNGELSYVDKTVVVNTNPEMTVNRDSQSELSLPSFLDSNKQSVVTFIRDLDMYFELKKVPENLKLPLVLRAIKDLFAQNWVSLENHKINSYQSFKLVLKIILELAGAVQGSL